MNNQKGQNNMNNLMQLEVRITNDYGTKRVYPICETAILLAQLLNRKTFTPDDIATLKELGYTFIVTQETI